MTISARASAVAGMIRKEAEAARARSAARSMALVHCADAFRELVEKKAAEKSAKLVKRVEAVGEADPDGRKMKKVLFKFKDGDTGKTKCAAFVEIADTAERRRVGLSKRASIGRMDGMFFDCKGPFWMKDVNFPLDLCYLDDGGRITEKVAMAEDRLGTRLYPRTKDESVHAVELPSGFCDTFGLRVGDYVSVS